MTTGFSKRPLLTATLVGVLAFTFVVPSLAHALETPGLLNCIGPAATPTCAIYYITLFTNSVLGFFVTIAGWLMGFAFSLTLEAIKLPAVQIGFAFTLSFANLGFVLGIIVIAIATILRNQTYGIKKILGKLIVMAILINFSLTIAGTIVNTSDNLSRLFLSQMAPGSETGEVGSTWAGVQGFVNALTTAFGPTSLFRPPSLIGAFDLKALTKATFNMIFGSLFLGLMLIVYLAIDVMLIIRSVYLALLIVVMPFAWVSWVFPISQKNWTEWWDKFLKWVFFPPIALFFLYLAVLTVQTSSVKNCLQTSGGSCDLGMLKDSLNTRTGGPAAAVVGLIGAENLGGESGSGVLAGIAQMLIVMGLAVGGLFAAQKVGAVGAGAAVSAASAAGQGFVNWGWRKSSGALARYATTPRVPPPGANWRQRIVNSVSRPFQGILAPPAARDRASQQAAQRQAAAQLPVARREAQAAQATAEQKRQTASAARQTAQGVLVAGHAPDSPEAQRAVAAANAAEQEAHQAEESAAQKKTTAENLEKKAGGSEGRKAEESRASAPVEAPSSSHSAPRHEAAPAAAGAPAAAHPAPTHPAPGASAVPIPPPHTPTAPATLPHEPAPKEPERRGEKEQEGFLGPKSILEDRPLFDYDLLSKDIFELAGKRLAKGFLRSVGLFPRTADAKGLRQRLFEYGQGQKLKAPTLLGATFGSAAKAAWKGAFSSHGVHLSKKDQEAIAHALNIHGGGGHGHEEKEGGGHPKEDHAAEGAPKPAEHH